MKIVILNEPNYRAGGVESLYQLCHIVNEISDNGYIHFVKKIDNPIPEEYRKYNIKTIDHIDDNSDTLVIIPEVWTERIYEFKQAKVGIWWLSVDNNHGKFKDFQNNNIYHFYQSEYAKKFLIDNNCKYIYPLHDYIDGVYRDDSQKQNTICYNPAKGKEATDFVIQNCPNLKFIPLVDMSKDDILKNLNMTKIYIDFGHHPGRDRIPRESIICDNILITSHKGSAKFGVDVPIPPEYKWTVLDENVESKLRYYLDNYDQEIQKFLGYKDAINEQKNILFEEVKNLIKIWI
jgi:hypothetical protein